MVEEISAISSQRVTRKLRQLPGRDNLGVSFCISGNHGTISALQPESLTQIHNITVIMWWIFGVTTTVPDNLGKAVRLGDMEVLRHALQ